MRPILRRLAIPTIDRAAAVRASAAILGVLLLLTLAGCSRQSQYPSRPLTLVCPWSAGGGTDRVARQIAAELEGPLGVPVNVVNATGGGGVTGHTRGAQARPDGYTMTIITVELNMLHWRGLTNLTYQDFRPLQLLNRDAAALFVPADSPYQSLDDLEAAIGDSEGRLKVSGTALGGIWHLALAGWLDTRGLPADAIAWISINGAAPSIQELLAGGLDFVCCSLPEADAVLSGGQVRCLGVMSPQRIPGYDQVPTFTELGHAWSMAGWRGLAVPKETPPERVDVLLAALQRVTGGESFRQFMASSGFNVSIEGPEDFAQTLHQQDELFGGILTQPAFSAVAGEHFGPLMFPTLLVGLMLVTTLFVARQAVPEAGDPARDVVAENQLAVAGSARLRCAAVLAAVPFYLLASERLGFLPTAALMLAGLLAAFGTSWRAVAGVSLVTSAVSYQIFGVLLRVPLPRGWIEW